MAFVLHLYLTEEVDLIQQITTQSLQLISILCKTFEHILSSQIIKHLESPEHTMP